MQLGITTFLHEGAMAPAALAVAVEERGFSSLWVPEHTHLPVRADVPPALVGGVDLQDYRRGLDPVVTLAMAAAVTERITLGTGVLLVAQHHPILLAKQLATLDRISGGRMRLGVGFGWNRPEAEDHGVPFARRHAVAREHLAAMQALWGPQPAEYHGETVEIPPCWAEPRPAGRIPVLIGGGAGPRVFDAVVHGADGWLPIGGSGLASDIPRLRSMAAAHGRDPDEITVIPFGTLPTPGKLAHFATLGITEVVLRVRAGSPAQMLAELDAHRMLLEAVS